MEFVHVAISWVQTHNHSGEMSPLEYQTDTNGNKLEIVTLPSCETNTITTYWNTATFKS